MPPLTFQSPRNKERAAAIAAELSRTDYDIICLQKVFDRSARKMLWRGLQQAFPYQYGPANDHGFFLKTNSGVWIISRLPLTDYHEIQFRAAANVERFSRKGAIFLRGNHAGQEFQLVSTHLQGEEGPVYTETHQAVRNLQMQQISRELLDVYGRRDIPLVITGDFITPRRDEANPAHEESAAYRRMIDLFQARNGGEDRITLDDDRAHNDMARDNTRRLVELDYILVRDGNASATDVEWSRVVLRHGGWDGKKNRHDLSYRYAVAAAITFGSR